MVWNGAGGAVDGAERCRKCGRWRGMVPQGTSACEHGFQGQPVIEHYSGCRTFGFCSLILYQVLGQLLPLQC
jgi:hypothetical protein